MKTLVVLAHPGLGKSVINKRWKEELEKHPDKFFVHDLYGAYPDGKIDADSERKLIEKHGGLIMQFPFYWFGSPSLLKKWMDEVLPPPWACAAPEGAGNMVGRKVAIAVSAGIEEKDYGRNGRYKYTLEELTSPFEATFAYMDSDYKPMFSLCGTEYSPSSDDIEKSAADYLRFASQI